MHLEDFMKDAKNARLAFALGLLAFGGAPALAGEGQEQARLLLAGRDAASGKAGAQSVSASSIAANSVAVDGQAQARLMIVGAHAKTAGIEDHAVAAGAPREKTADPLAMARQMILGSASEAGVAKVRLADKTE